MPDISRRKGFPPSVKASSRSWASAHDHAVPQGTWAALGTRLPSFCALLTAITALNLHIKKLSAAGNMSLSGIIQIQLSILKSRRRAYSPPFLVDSHFV